MSVRDKIKEILSENYKSLNGTFGQKQNKGKSYLRREDAKRKKKQRAKADNKPKTKKELEEEQSLSPKEKAKLQRRQLEGEMKLTPLECIGSRLAAYLETRNSKHMFEIFGLMEDYPELAKFVRDKSVAALPKYPFNVYSTREWLGESIGDRGHRSDGRHNWYLSKQKAKKLTECDKFKLIECGQVSPEDVILYIPAFSKLIERCILEGLIDEPSKNVVREAKTCEEIVLPEKYVEGVIIEIDD
jgi:hypothetical protein